MALVTKMTRCAVCGSSDVSFDGKTYHCAPCGTDSDVSMPAADIAAVNRIVAMGNDAEAELPRLRRQYRNLESLDRETLLRLIDKIEIGEQRIVDGLKEREIRIYYKFVGYIG